VLHSLWYSSSRGAAIPMVLRFLQHVTIPEAVSSTGRAAFTVVQVTNPTLHTLHSASYTAPYTPSTLRCA